jgi:hypothetical protein
MIRRRDQNLRDPGLPLLGNTALPRLKTKPIGSSGNVIAGSMRYRDIGAPPFRERTIYRRSLQQTEIDTPLLQETARGNLYQ